MSEKKNKNEVDEAAAELLSGFESAATHYRQGRAITAQFAVMGLPVAFVVGAIWFAFQWYGHILFPVTLGLVGTGTLIALVKVSSASRKRYLQEEAEFRAEKEGRKLPETRERLIAYCRDKNRICPKPQHWHQLWMMLPNRSQVGVGVWEPAQPLILAAWIASDEEKSDRLREHLEWADKHGALEPVGALLRSLREEDWHHVGE